MSKFKRKGHYRTNSSGTKYWVSEHEVFKEEYHLSIVGDASFVNGTRVVPDVLCKYCYRKVFFYQNDRGSKVYFDSLGKPWPKHACYHEQFTKPPKSTIKNSVPTRILAPEEGPNEPIIEQRETKKTTARNAARPKGKPAPNTKKSNKFSKEKAPKKEAYLAARAAKRARSAKENEARARWLKWRETEGFEVEVRNKKRILRQIDN